MKFVLLSFLIWRILLFIPLILGNILLPYRIGYEYTNIWNRIAEYFPVNHFLVYPWANFDGVHYLSIASFGYTTEGNFFPLYPLLINILAQAFGGGQTLGAAYFFSGLIITNLCFFLSLIFLYKLILLDFSTKVAKQSIIFLLIFPTSFYFGAIYSESLFLLLVVCSFYLARKNNWFLANIFAMFSTSTRLTGIVIWPALIYHFFKKEGLKFSLKFLPSILVPMGLISYVVFNFYKWGDFLYFIKVHGTFANSRSVDSIVLFPQTIFRYIKILATLPFSYYEWWIALLELVTFSLVALLLYVGWKKRVNAAYLIFAVVSFLIPVSSGTFNGLPRYTVVLFSIFIALALIKNKVVKLLYMILSPILLFVLIMFFARGYFVA